MSGAEQLRGEKPAWGGEWLQGEQPGAQQDHPIQQAWHYDMDEPIRGREQDDVVEQARDNMDGRVMDRVAKK